MNTLANRLNRSFTRYIAASIFLTVQFARAESPADAIQAGSVWKDGGKLSLTILERTGDTFRGRFVSGGAVREFSGPVKGDQISLLEKDARLISGNARSDNFGTIRGNRIDFTWIGVNGHRGVFTLVRQAPTNLPAPVEPAAIPQAPPAKVAAPASSASQGKLDELREHAMALTESVLGSLDQDTGASFRGYISDLREDILDEAAKKPAAGANAYNLAVQLCNTIIAVEREREVMIARLDNNKPSNAAGSAAVTKVHPNWRDLERERDEAARATHNNTLETSFHRQITVQWGLRAAQLRKTFDAEIAQFRTGLRQSIPPR